MEKKLAEIIKNDEEYLEKFEEMFENITVLKTRFDKVNLVTGSISDIDLDLTKKQLQDKIEEMNEFLNLIQDKYKEDL